MYDKKLLQILLDSGSTHNFLDLEVAKKLGCKLEKVSSLPMTAGGGTTLEAPYICRGFTWQLQQMTFTADVIVLPLVYVISFWVFSGCVPWARFYGILISYRWNSLSRGRNFC